MSQTIIKEMIGAVIAEIQQDVDVLQFKARDGTSFNFYHDQYCCESVEIEDVCGDLDDLKGSPIIEASENISGGDSEDGYHHLTWTFYRFSTVKGTVTVRWRGESNGYYSESVDFEVKRAGAK